MVNPVLPQDLERVNKLLKDQLHEYSYETIERLGGLTNHTYKVTLKCGSSYTVRIPGKGTEELINRNNEKISTLLACKIGIDAPLVYFGDNGEKITHYIHGAETMSSETLKLAVNLVKVAHTLQKLHSCGENTGIAFDVFDMAASYESIIKTNHVFLFEGYSSLKYKILNIKNYIDNTYHPLSVPCHNDPLCENWILSDKNDIFLIDWEYAGMNDRMWDLADVSLEAGLSSEQDRMLLQTYHGSEVTIAELQQFHANKLYIDYLWALWGKARVPYDGIAMEEYAMTRFNRLKINLEEFEILYHIKYRM